MSREMKSDEGTRMSFDSTESLYALKCDEVLNDLISSHVLEGLKPSPGILSPKPTMQHHRPRILE